MADNRYYYFKDAKGNRHTVDKTAYDKDPMGFAKAFPGARMEVIDRKTGRRGDVDVKDVGRVGDFGAHLFTGRTVGRKEGKVKSEKPHNSALGRAQQSVARQKWGGGVVTQGNTTAYESASAPMENDSELVRGLKNANAVQRLQAPVSYTKSGAVKQMVKQTRERQHVVGQNVEQAGREAGRNAEEEIRRRNAPAFDLGNEDVNNNLVKTRGQLEKEMEESSALITDKNFADTFANMIAGEKQAAEKRGFDAYLQRAVWGATPMGSALLGTIAYNAERDPAKLQQNLLNSLGENMESMLSDPNVTQKVITESKRLGVDPEDYVKTALMPAIQNKLMSEYDKTELKEWMPRNTFVDIIEGVGDGLRGGAFLDAILTKAQRQYRQQATIATQNGKNPYYQRDKHGVTEGVRSALSLASDAIGPDGGIFGNIGKGVGAASAKVFGNEVKTVARMANMTKLQRMFKPSILMRGAAEGAANFGIYEGLKGAQSYASTTDDAKVGEMLKESAVSAAHGAVSGATLGVVGNMLGGLGYNVGIKGPRGIDPNFGKNMLKGLGMKGVQIIGEGTAFYAGGNINNALSGVDTDWSAGNLLSNIMAAGIYKIVSTHTATGAAKMLAPEKGSSYGDTVAVKFGTALYKAAMAPSAQGKAFAFTQDEKQQLFAAGDKAGMPGREGYLGRPDILTWAERVSKATSVGKEDKSGNVKKVREYYESVMQDPNVSWDAKMKLNALLGIAPATRPEMDMRTYTIEDGKRYVNEYAKDGTLLSKRSYKNMEQREAIEYDLMMQKENQRMLNGLGYILNRDCSRMDLQMEFLRQHDYDFDNPDSPRNQAIMDDMLGNNKTLTLKRGRTLHDEWLDFVSENGITTKLIKDIADAHGLSVEEMFKIVNKEPIKRTEEEQRACVELRKALNNIVYEDGMPHADQADSDGKDVVEENNLGTENPNNEAVAEVLNNMKNAEKAFNAALESNDVLKQEYERLTKEGLSEPQIYMELINSGLTQEQLAPFADYINAKAKAVGMYRGTEQKIAETVQKHVEQWSYKGELNGEKQEGGQILFVKDNNGRLLIVGAGDVAFDSEGRARENVGDMLSVLDPNTKEMDFVSKKDVQLDHVEKTEDYAKNYQEMLEVKNSVAYAQNEQQQQMEKPKTPTKTGGVAPEVQPKERKQVLRSLSMLDKVSSPKDKLNEIRRIEQNVEFGEKGAITPEEQAHVDEVLAELKEQGYEMDNDGIVGSEYVNNGRNDIIVDNVYLVEPGDPRYDKLEDGQTVIDKIIKPKILKDGEIYQPATVTAIFRADTSVSERLYEAKRKLAGLLKADGSNEIIQREIAKKKAEIAELEKKKAEELASKPQQNPTKETEKKPVPTFADGSPVPMMKDTKGRETADYSQMTPEHGAEWMSSQFGENAEAAVDGQIKRAEKMLKEAEKIKVDYTGDLNDAKEAEAQKAKAVDAAKAELELYTNIKKVMTANKVKAGMEKVGSAGEEGSVSEAGNLGAVREKFESGKRIVGNKRTRTLADGSKLRGHYEIVEADSLTPSHNANDGYKKSEGFPVNEEGRTINDRDYENDKDAQRVTDMIARHYDGQAVDQVPVVTADGIVVDGNGRTMAGQKAAKDGTDGAYLEALKENAENYGFTAEQIEQSGMKHPRLVLVSDEPMKYDTATFAKFNMNEKKSQGNTQQAVANSKKLSTDEISVIVSEIEGSGSLDAFFNNSTAINSLLKRLVDKGVIGLNEIAGLREGEDKLSAAGKDFVKNLLLGSVFSENTIRMMGADAMLKTKALNGIRAVTDNMKLGDYALMKEIDQAVQLLYEARQKGGGVDAYLRTPAMFGENAADRFDPISQAIALALEGKVEDFRELMMAYNRNAAHYADASQAEMFGERPTKEDFVNEFLKLRNWKDYETRHSSKEGNGDAGSSEGGEPETSGGSGRRRKEGLAKSGDKTLERKNIGDVSTEENGGPLEGDKEGKPGNDNGGSPDRDVQAGEEQREVDKAEEEKSDKPHEASLALTEPVEPTKPKGEEREGELPRTEEIEGDLAPQNKFKAYIESRDQGLKQVSPVAKALKEAVESGDKKRIKNAQKDLVEAILASPLGHGYLSSYLSICKNTKKNDKSYNVNKALIKPLTEVIKTIESALDSALKDAGLEGVHLSYDENGEGWIYADKNSPWYAQLKALDNDYRNISQIKENDPIAKLPQITLDNVADAARIIKSVIEEGERYNEYTEKEELNKEPLSILPKKEEKAFDPIGKAAENYKKDHPSVRMQKVDDADYIENIPKEYRDFSDEHKVNPVNLFGYGESMKYNDSAAASRYLHDLKAMYLREHVAEKKALMEREGVSGLIANRRLFAPIEKAIKEKYGDVDVLIEERKKRVEAERNVMEAARKRAEEEERKRQQHLEELSLIPDGDLDKRYLEAMEKGDETTAREMLDEAARRKGYGDAESDYQGVGAWSAPSDPGFVTAEERRADVKENGGDVNVEDIAAGYSPVQEEMYSHPERTGFGDEAGIEAGRAINDALNALKAGKTDVKIKVYRAVPTSVKEGKLRNGDWVTPSRKYAEMHGEHRLDGKYRIMEDEVPASELWFDGNDIREWGYDNGKSYRYKNVKNSRKLNDLVTRDDKGNVIPPSKRFNQRKADERYQRGVGGVKPSKAEVALRDAVIDRLRESGMDVIADEAEGQRVLDEVNGRGETVRSQAMLSSLTKAVNTIRGWLATGKRGKSFTIELPEATQRMIRKVMGRDFDSHNITANGVAHAQKNHGVNGNKISDSSIPLREQDMELMPYIMVAPDYVRKGSEDVTGRTSVRFYKELSNGYVVVAEKEYKNSPDDMETITMWAEMSDKATNAQHIAAPDTHVRNAILDIDAAKIRKDAEDAIVNDVKVRENRVYHGSGSNGVRFFRTANGEAYGFTVGGKIYIDPKIATSETPVHEYAHLWAEALRNGNSKEWQNVVELMKDTKVWDEVKARYPELKSDGDIADEVIATYSGRRGAERLREELRKTTAGNGGVLEKIEAISAFEKVRQSLEKFWKGVADFLHIRYTSAEEVADRVMKDLLDGVDPRGSEKRKVKSEKSNGNPRFQFIGEKGAAEADHAEEVSVRLDNLSVARDMEAEKKDAKAIKMATGWERGADGKWRYEIADMKEFDRNGNLLYRKHHPDYARYIELQDKELKNLFEDGEELTDKEREEYEALSKKYESDKFGGEKLDNNHTLEAYVDAPELFKAYPELRNVRMTFMDTGGDEIASYHHISSVFEVDKDDVGEIVVNTGKVSANTRTKELKSVVLHEMQHAIQDMEGFARGGNTERMKSDFLEAKAEWAARAYAHELEETAKALGEDYDQLGVERALIKEYEDMDMSYELPDKDTRIKGFNYFARGYADRSLDEAIKRFRLNESTRGDFNPYIEYSRLAGEVEARNVQKRMDMSAEERRASLAAETEDVAREDQIFLMGNGVDKPHWASMSLSKPMGKDVMENIKLAAEAYNKAKAHYRMELGNTFSDGKEHFDAVRDRAVEEKGIVMPNLNKEKVKVVEVEKHGFGSKERETINNAKAWAISNLVTTGKQDLPTMRDGTAYTISKKAIDKYLSESAVKKSENLDTHLSVLTKLTDVIHESIEAEIHADYNVKDETGKRKAELGYGNNILVHRLYGAVEIDGKMYRVKTTMQEFRGGEENKPHSYEVTKIELLDSPGKRENPDRPPSDASNNSIDTAKLLQGVEKSYDSGKKLLDESKDLTDGETFFRKEGNGVVTPEKTSNAVSERIIKTVEKVAKRTGGKVKMVNSVEEIENPKVRKDIENGKQVTGWYDEKTGEVHLYMPNIHDTYTAEKTVWHETVGHKGMRGLLGDKFNDYMRSLWMDLDNPINAELRAYVKEKMNMNHLGFYDAIEEFIAKSAEDGKGEPGFWNYIKNKVTDALHEIGYRVSPNVKDVKYMLWLAKNVQKHGDSPLWKMRAEAVKWKIEHEKTLSVVEENGMMYDNNGKKHGLLDLNKKDFDEATDGHVHYRTSPMTASKIEEYNRRLSTKWYAFKESTVDDMQSLQEAMQIISGVKDAYTDIPSAFNPLQCHNRMGSMVMQMCERYDREYTEPLGNAFKKVVSAMPGKDGAEQTRNANLYFIKKHGLERNRVLFVRDKIREERKVKSEESDSIDALETAWKDERSDLRQKLDSGQIDLKEYYRQMDEWIVQNLDKDFKAEEHDYSGMHGIYDVKKGEEYDDANVIDEVMSTESQLGADLVKSFWDAKKKATDFTIDQVYANGFKDKNERDHLKEMFDWYVPLRKFDDTVAEDVYGYISGGDTKNGIGSVIEKARGRESLSDVNVLAQISALAKSSILNGGKNVEKQHFMRFVEAYEKGDAKDRIFVEIQPWVEKHTVDGNEVWEEVMPNIPENSTQEQINDILNTFEADMKAKQANGEAKVAKMKSDIGYKFERSSDMNQHIVNVYVNGRVRRFVCQGNPRAAQAINGLLRDSGTQHWATEQSAKLNRICAQLNTSLNPDFVSSNLVRDLTAGSANLVAKEGMGYTWDFCMEYAKNWGSMVRRKDGRFDGGYLGMFRRYKEGRLDANNQKERWFKEFMDNGGETGFVSLKKYEDIIKEYDNLVKTGNKEGDRWLMKKLKEGGAFIELANEVVENVARYSTYCVSRKRGRSIGKSIYDAKEVSSNFNRHGSGDAIKSLKTEYDGKTDAKFRKSVGWFNSWMKNHTMFYNAGVQGANLFAKNLYNNTKTTAIAFGAMPFGLSLAVALFNLWRIGREDEKKRNGVKNPYAELPEWKRRNNLCIYLGGGDFKTIPMGIELRAFYGLGDIAAGYVVDESLKSDVQIGWDIIGQMAQLVPASDFLGHHSPSSGIKELVEDALLSATPTIAKPGFELAFNRDWTGRPIYRDNDYLDKAPRWKRAYDSTNDAYMTINKWANKTFNGIDSTNEDLKGSGMMADAVDFFTAPYGLQHIVEGYTGGTGATIGRMYQTGKSFAKGVVSGIKDDKGFAEGFNKEWDKVNPNDIPFYRVFNYTPKEGNDMQRTKSKWYNYADELEQLKYNMQQMKTNTPDTAKNIHNAATKFKFSQSKEGRKLKIYEAADRYITAKRRILKKAKDKAVVEAVNEAVNRKMQEAVEDLDRIE